MISVIQRRQDYIMGETVFPMTVFWENGHPYVKE